MVSIWKSLFFGMFFIELTLGPIHSKPLENMYSALNQGDLENSIIEQDLANEKIEFIAQKVMEQLVQETDENYKVLAYENKRELIKSFQKYTSLSLAKKLVNLYYEERNNALYIIPTETPPWLQKGQTFEKNKISTNMVEVIQTNRTDLYGEYTIKMEFRFDDDYGWILENVTYMK